jgi:hypothetical protein
MKTYLRNCFLLVLPALVWNIFLTSRLPQRWFAPQVFDNIPGWLAVAENILRLLVFFLPLLMPLQIKTRLQKTGLALYFLGLALYFASWLALIYAPDSAWSSSLVGLLGPAYTPLVWLVGIGLVSSTLYLPLPYQPAYYIALSAAFITVHCTHACIAFLRAMQA